MGKTDWLENKTVIVTGAGSGIGREVALCFAEHGANLVLLDLSQVSLENVCEAINLKGKSASFIVTDISDEKSVKQTFDTIRHTTNCIDVLVNVAGIYDSGNVVKTTLEQWNKLIAVNLTGVFLCMKETIPLMRGKGASIINIASEAGLVGISNQVAYNVSKAGVIALTKSAAVDYANQNIRVNCVCPGRVHTPLVQEIIDNSESPEDTFKELSYDRPLMRMGKASEIAKACLMFASDEIGYATGSVFSIDGGYTTK